MKGIVTYLFVAASMVLMSASCERDPETVPDGNVRLLISVNHHGYPIANATVFRKDDTIGFPGYDTTLYDARYVTDAEGNLVITGLGNGSRTMTLFAKGFDPAWDSLTVTPVSGYQFVNISTAVGESKDFTVTIPVSE